MKPVIMSVQHGFLMAVAAVILLGTSPALAAKHTNGFEQKSERNQTMKHEGGFIVRKGIRDDYTVIFHVMRAPEGMRYSKEHYHLMVVVEKDHKPVVGLQMTSKALHPDGTSEQKPMMHMGEWYMALYNLSHEQGRHLITVHFNIESKKYTAHAYYPEINYTEEAQ